MIAQELLRAELERRLEGAAPGDGPVVVVVLHELDLGPFVAGALEFALGIAGERRASDWRRGLTRTVFLAGNPDNIAGRHPPDHSTPDRSIAWFGPAPPAAHDALSRLLRAFEGPVRPAGRPRTLRIRVPGSPSGPPRERRLYLDTADIGLQEYLVHLHHSLCETALDDRLRPGDEFEILHVDEIQQSTWDYARVGSDTRDSGQLRLYACLTDGGG